MSNQRWFKKQLDLDAFYLAIHGIFAAFGAPYGADNKIVPNGFFWSSLAINTILRSQEYSAEPTQNQCSNKEEEITRYSYLHTESIMLMLGLMALSWLKLDLKRKTENGHCHHLIHKAKDTDKAASCPIRSNFHKDLYSDYISVLEDFLNNVRNSAPMPISSSN